jgi:cell division protease FtsH
MAFHVKAEQAMKKDTRFHVGYWIAAFIGIMILQYFYVTARQVATIPYSQFEQLLKEGKVAEIGVSDRFIQGMFREPLDGKSRFVTTRVDPEFAEELQRYNVRYTGQIESTFLSDLLSWVVPVLLFFGLWAYLARRMAESGGLAAASCRSARARPRSTSSPTPA